LSDGRAFGCSAWNGAWPSDRRPLLANLDGRPYRLHAVPPATWRGLEPALRRRAALALDVLAPVEVVPIADGAVVIAAALPDARPALAVPALPFSDPIAELENLLEACRTVAAALAPLHGAGFAWLEFDPDCLVTAGGRSQITNLDLALSAPGARHPAYVAPEGNAAGGPTDVYHLCLYAYYRLACLLPGGFPGRGPAAFDFGFPPLRVYRPDLLPGVAPVLACGLRRDPGRRFASLADLLAALEGAVEQARRRQAGAGALSYDLGGRTIAGRAKTAQRRPNQDALLVQPAGPSGLPLVVVADGVTHARVGSGHLASRIVCDELAAVLPGLLGQAQTPGQRTSALESACVAASQAVVRRAMAQGRLPPKVEANDLMSSTALIGVVQDGMLSLACVGDSRAYLITNGGAEQLTVDGDVRCVELARGTPPENVRAAGSEALALCRCLGVAQITPGGRFRCDIERSLPQVTHWRLLPGDVVLLCSDGLIEEGLFLDPAEASALVSELAHLPAKDLAERLVAAADERQRLPSPEEPEGFGDNITCMVLKVLADSGG
jgi:serine/threonine protein phosphatase PrpC